MRIGGGNKLPGAGPASAAVAGRRRGERSTAVSRSEPPPATGGRSPGMLTGSEPLTGPCATAAHRVYYRLDLYFRSFLGAPPHTSGAYCIYRVSSHAALFHFQDIPKREHSTCPCLRMKITLPLQQGEILLPNRKSGSKVDRSPPLGPGLADERMQVAFPGRR